LHIVPPQLVLPGVSAVAMVGITKVLTNNTATPRMSRILFTVFFSLLEKLDRDIFMSALWRGQKSLNHRSSGIRNTLGVRNPGVRNPVFVTHDA
jgi:hypothetical protein